jgi:hypothetical protein
MKTYPEFIRFYEEKVRNLRLYNVDDDIGTYYNLTDNFHIGVAWDWIGLKTVSSDPHLDGLPCYEITKEEFKL